MDNASSLTAQQLRYSLGSRRLINDVSLNIACGEMVAIIGPNGAGKSTLLRLLTGYLSPGCGECQLLGRPLDQWQPQQLAKVRAVMRQHSDWPFRLPSRKWSAWADHRTASAMCSKRCSR